MPTQQPPVLELTPHQKAVALNALDRIALRLNREGKWYVEQHVRIHDKHTQRGTGATGDTPDAAIEAQWEALTSHLEVDEYVEVDGKRVEWIGFMWRELPKPTPMKTGATS